MALLEIRDLRVYYRSGKSVVRAVDGVSLSIDKGEALCLVGESGSGKSTLGLAVAGLIEAPGEIAGGEVIFDGVPIASSKRISTEGLLGRRITMIFQDPRSSLNPVMRIGDQISEVLIHHTGLSREEALEKTLSLLREVQIPDPQRIVKSYPHELSGGMAQRVVIAMAIATRPDLIIADEPTSALDVTVQAQILRLLRFLVEESRSSMLFITHDLSVALEMCKRTAIMYAGKLVEEGPTQEIMMKPLHPYTAFLLESVPKIGSKGRLNIAAGEPPDLRNPPPGCRFHPRCPFVMDICRKEEPLAVWMSSRRIACFLHNHNR